MKTEHHQQICPVERAGSLDNKLRMLLQNPKKILNPFIKNGMTVLDLGCGPGFFSVEIAKILGSSGKVIAADIQEGMLDKLKKKIEGTVLEENIQLCLCKKEKFSIHETVDLILAFYMFHEVPNQNKLFNEFKSLLKPNGKILIVEPKFHVSKKSFENMLDIAKINEFKIEVKPKIFFSRAVLLTNYTNI